MDNVRVRRVVLPALLLVLLMVTIFGCGSVSAGTPVFAIGEVVDGDGNPIEGADVSVTCNGNTKTDTTNSIGHYGVDFTGLASAGDSVYVEATYQGHTGSKSGYIEDFNYVQISDITVKIPIPEFTTIAIPVAMVLGIVFFMQKRKSE